MERARAAGRDLLAFLEGRRPGGTAGQDWDAELWAGLALREVPGMGQFDVVRSTIIRHSLVALTIHYSH